MKKPLKFNMYWHGLGYVFVSAVVFLSLSPPPDIPLEDIPWIDKVFHFLAYGFLMLWFAQLYVRTVFWVLATLFFVMGVSLEVAQSLTDDRFFEVADMVANGMGVGFGWFAACAGLNSFFETFEKCFVKNGRDEKI